MKNFALLRTNPYLTTNYKLSYDAENDKIYLNSFSANTLSGSRYKNVSINPSSSFATDISRFYNGSPMIDLYHNIENTYDIKSNLDYAADSTYYYGSAILNDDEYGKNRISIFAPVFLHKNVNVPKYFVVFRIKLDGYLMSRFKGEDLHSSAAHDVIIDEYWSSKQIVDVINIEKSSLGNYLNRYVYSGMTDTYHNLSNIVYSGIDINTGVFKNAIETIDYLMYDNTSTVMNYGAYISEGFKRNGIIYPNIINLEFIFNDKVLKETGGYEYSEYIYFGLYADAIPVGSFIIDKPGTTNVNFYRNGKFMIKEPSVTTEMNKLRNDSYSYVITTTQGIKDINLVPKIDPNDDTIIPYSQDNPVVIDNLPQKKYLVGIDKIIKAQSKGYYDSDKAFSFKVPETLKVSDYIEINYIAKTEEIYADDLYSNLVVYFDPYEEENCDNLDDDPDVADKEGVHYNKVNDSKDIRCIKFPPGNATETMDIIVKYLDEIANPYLIIEKDYDNNIITLVQKVNLLTSVNDIIDVKLSSSFTPVGFYYRPNKETYRFATHTDKTNINSKYIGVAYTELNYKSIKGKYVMTYNTREFDNTTRHSIDNGFVRNGMLYILCSEDPISIDNNFVKLYSLFTPEISILDFYTMKDFVCGEDRNFYAEYSSDGNISKGIKEYTYFNKIHEKYIAEYAMKNKFNFSDFTWVARDSSNAYGLPYNINSLIQYGKSNGIPNIFDARVSTDNTDMLLNFNHFYVYHNPNIITEQNLSPVEYAEDDERKKLVAQYNVKSLDASSYVASKKFEDAVFKKWLVTKSSLNKEGNAFFEMHDNYINDLIYNSNWKPIEVLNNSYTQYNSYKDEIVNKIYELQNTYVSKPVEPTPGEDPTPSDTPSVPDSGQDATDPSQDTTPTEPAVQPEPEYIDVLKTITEEDHNFIKVNIDNLIQAVLAVDLSSEDKNKVADIKIGLTDILNTTLKAGKTLADEGATEKINEFMQLLGELDKINAGNRTEEDLGREKINKEYAKIRRPEYKDLCSWIKDFFYTTPNIDDYINIKYGVFTDTGDVQTCIYKGIKYTLKSKLETDNMAGWRMAIMVFPIEYTIISAQSQDFTNLSPTDTIIVKEDTNTLYYLIFVPIQILFPKPVGVYSIGGKKYNYYTRSYNNFMTMDLINRLNSQSNIAEYSGLIKYNGSKIDDSDPDVYIDMKSDLSKIKISASLPTKEFLGAWSSDEWTVSEEADEYNRYRSDEKSSEVYTISNIQHIYANPDFDIKGNNLLGNKFDSFINGDKKIVDLLRVNDYNSVFFKLAVTIDGESFILDQLGTMAKESEFLIKFHNNTTNTDTSFDISADYVQLYESRKFLRDRKDKLVYPNTEGEKREDYNADWSGEGILSEKYDSETLLFTTKDLFMCTIGYGLVYNEDINKCPDFMIPVYSESLKKIIPGLPKDFDNKGSFFISYNMPLDESTIKSLMISAHQTNTNIFNKFTAYNTIKNISSKLESNMYELSYIEPSTIKIKNNASLAPLDVKMTTNDTGSTLGYKVNHNKFINSYIDIYRYNFVIDPLFYDIVRFNNGLISNTGYRYTDCGIIPSLKFHTWYSGTVDISTSEYPLSSHYTVTDYKDYNIFLPHIAPGYYRQFNTDTFTHILSKNRKAFFGSYVTYTPEMISIDVINDMGDGSIKAFTEALLFNKNADNTTYAIQQNDVNVYNAIIFLDKYMVTDYFQTKVFTDIYDNAKFKDESGRNLMNSVVKSAKDKYIEKDILGRYELDSIDVSMSTTVDMDLENGITNITVPYNENNKTLSFKISERGLYDYKLTFVNVPYTIQNIGIRINLRLKDQYGV